MMLTINSGIDYFSGTRVQPNVMNASEKGAAAATDNTTEKTDEVTISSRARQIDQTYREKKYRLEEKHDRESEKLEREYMREKKRIEQEYRHKKQSLEINVYV